MTTMKYEKILLISFNSPFENTGGGHYLRALLSGYSKITKQLTLAVKKNEKLIPQFGLNQNMSLVEFKRNTWLDFLGRVMGCSSFMIVYARTIVKLMRHHDLVVIYSSRLGFFALAARWIARRPTIIHYDNCETLLSLQRLRVSGVSLKGLVLIYDTFLNYISEYICKITASRRTFITSTDQEIDGGPGDVIPICFRRCHLSIASPNDYYIFTGSFDFEPNKTALKELVLIAKRHPNNQFVAAGRKLIDLRISVPANLKIISDPDGYEMVELIKNAFAYISPVRLGSGMKTKVGEALCHGLPIIGTRSSFIGYEVLRDFDFMHMYESIEDIGYIFTQLSKKYPSRQHIANTFYRFYSTKTSDKMISDLVEDS